MNKIVLYINTLSYLSLSQIFFLGYNKVVKKFLNRYLLRIDKITMNPKIKTDFRIISKNIQKVLGTNDTWQLGVSELKSHSEYYYELKRNIILFSENSEVSYLKKLWTIKSDDIELNYNYQRFYLFKEVFDEIKLPFEKQIELILKWVDHNTKNNLAWMGFNCAIRLINWMKILKDIDVNKLRVEQWEIIESSIFQQFVFNSRNIEHHIPGNHILFQYYSEWLISSIFIKWDVQQNQKEIKLNRLLKEFEDEYLDDGLHFELSTHYHLQVTLLGLSLVTQLSNLGITVSKDFLLLLNKATSVLDEFIIGDYYPAIGDGCYNFFHENKYQDIENVNYLKNKCLTFKEEKKDQILIDNNFQICTNNLFKIIFDVGNIGLNNNPGHGHADLLSIVLGYNNLPIFIDPGTYQYKNSEESLALKKSNFHNTVSIDGEDQAKLWGFFRWAYLPTKIKAKFSENYLEGEYYGYKHLGGVFHKRSITSEVNKIRIKDSLNGNLGQNIKITFILHPGITIEQKKNSIFIKSNLNSFELKSSSLDVTFSVEDIFVYDSYNIGTESKKIVFQTNNNKEIEFNSEILFKVLN